MSPELTKGQTNMSIVFDGPAGRLTALVMARMNAAAEREAVDMLAPGPNDHILVIGFGPGVGLQYLARRHPKVQIVGIDPAEAMMTAAARRNRAALSRGQIHLVRATVEQLDMPAASFDAAIAVHSLQLCEPISATAAKLGSLIRVGGRLVSITHDWAMARHAGSVEAFVDQARDAFEAAGFVRINSANAKAEKGRAVMFSAMRGEDGGSNSTLDGMTSQRR